MRTVKLTLDRTDLTATQGIDIRVYEASSMGDMAHIQTISVFDGEEKVFTINDRQAVEFRPANRYE